MKRKCPGENSSKHNTMENYPDSQHVLSPSQQT
jgi:hypothetical protein